MNKWDNRFIELAEAISGWSKDSTKVGSVLVNSLNRIVSTGYNGFGVGVDDSVENYANNEFKDELVTHSEDNCLRMFDYSESNAPYTLYVFGLPPCPNCCTLICHDSISRVVYKINPKYKKSKWVSKWGISKTLLMENNIKITEVL